VAEYCVVVVDHAKADIYRLPGPRGALQKLASFDNPGGHGHERDLGTSAPGRVSAGGSRRHTFDTRHTLREHALESFVRLIAAEVGGRVTGAKRETHILVVAAAPLLGLLRRFMPRATRCRVSELPRNLSKLPPATLARRLRAFIGVLQRQSLVGERV
jgi:hypothetical protein